MNNFIIHTVINRVNKYVGKVVNSISKQRKKKQNKTH